MKKTLLNILIITFCIVAILGIAIVLLNIWDEITADILFTNITIFGFSIPTLCCAILKEKGKHDTFASTGMIICALGCIYELAIIWGLINLSLSNILDTVKIFSTFIVLATTFGHLSLMLLIESDDSGVVGARNGTIIVSVIMDIMIISSLWSINVSYPWQAYVIIGILIALGTIVTPILSMVKKMEARGVQQPAPVPVEPVQPGSAFTPTAEPVQPQVAPADPVLLETPVEPAATVPSNDNELDLLKSLKDAGRISEEEYQTLANKMQNKSS